MGAVAQSVGNAVGGAFKSVGSIASGAVREIGKGAESLGREIGKVGQAAISNPVGTIAKVAAVATGQAWALPLISATEVVANGGNLEQALKAGAISYAASAVASSISNSLNSAFANELTSSVGDASLVSTNTLADGTIQHVFSDGSTILQGLNGALSTTPATIAPSVMSQIASQLPTSVLQSVNTALANAGGSAAMTALQGGDLSEVLLSGASGGVGSFTGTQTTQQLRDLGLNAKVAQVLGRTSGAAAAGAVEGQDASQIFNTQLVNNIVRTSLSEAGTALRNTEVARGLTRSLNEALQPFKDTVNEVKQSFLDQAKKLTELQTTADTRAQELFAESGDIQKEADAYYKDILKGAEANAQSAFQRASSSFNEYKSVSDEFSSLVAKYEEAKAANDVDLANQYADQANALVPRLNEVTDRYNADYGLYETAKLDFESKNQTYVGYIDKLNGLNTEYTQAYKAVEDQLGVVNQAAEQFNTSVDEMQTTLTQRAKDVEQAYTKASEYSPIAKSTFAELFGETGDLDTAANLSEQVNALPQNNQQMYEFARSFGLRAEDAIKFAPDISKMSVVAQQAFYDSLAESPDTTAAFNTANRINSLTKAQQESFFNARIQGLDNNQAFGVAQTMAGAPKGQQDIYINTLRSGFSDPLASLFAAAYEFTGDETPYESQLDKNFAALTTPEAKNAYKFYLNAFGPEGADQAFALAQGEEQSVLAMGTGTQTAGTNKIGFLPDRTGTVTVTQAPSMGAGMGVSEAQLQELENKLESGQITEQQYNDQYKQLFASGSGGAGSVNFGTPLDTSQDYYQALIDRLFSTPTIKPKTISTSTGAAQTAPTSPTTGVGTGTATDTTGLVSTGPTTTGGAGGTETVTGGAGGTSVTGGATGGTGAGGTGGGTGTGTGGGRGTGGFGIGGIGGGGFALPGGFGMFGLLGQQDTTGGIKNLAPGLTERMDYTLSGLPTDGDDVNPMFNAPQIIPTQMASGGSTSTYDPFSTKDTAGGSAISSSLVPGLTRAQLNYILTGLPDYLQGRAEGGHIEGHNPQFFSEGGLGALENRFVKGDGDGTSDSIPAMLADGEFVIPADVVSSLGNGSNDAGASVLDEFLRTIREHKRNADHKKLPPDSKGPLAYLIDAQRRAKA